MNDLKEIGGFIVSADPYVNHDNSLSGNGTLTSPLGVVPGYNETVLWSGSTQSGCVLSESINNFDRIKIEGGNNNAYMFCEVDPVYVSAGRNVPITCIPSFSNGYCSIYTQSWKFSDTTHFVSAAKCKECWGNTAAMSARDTGNQYVLKIIGINRKQ